MKEEHRQNKSLKCLQNFVFKTSLFKEKKTIKTGVFCKCFTRTYIKNVQLNDIAAFVKSRQKISETMVYNPECRVVQLISHYL